jgi:uncharacterized protein YjbJ (UPF0337 family)
MDNDRMKATVHELSDKIQDASGGVADHAKSQAKKLSAGAEGSIREAYGQATDAARRVSGGASTLAEEASAIAGDAYDRSGRRTDRRQHTHRSSVGGGGGLSPLLYRSFRTLAFSRLGMRPMSISADGRCLRLRTAIDLGTVSSGISGGIRVGAP